MEAAKGQHLRENADKVDGTGPDSTIRISCQNHGGCVKCMLQLSKPVGEVARPDSMLSVQLLMPQHNYLLIYTPCGVENLPILYKIPGWSHSISAYLELPLEKSNLPNMFYFSPFQ